MRQDLFRLLCVFHQHRAERALKLDLLLHPQNKVIAIPVFRVVFRRRNLVHGSHNLCSSNRMQSDGFIALGDSEHPRVLATRCRGRCSDPRCVSAQIYSNMPKKLRYLLGYRSAAGDFLATRLFESIHTLLLRNSAFDKKVSQVVCAQTFLHSGWSDTPHVCCDLR